MANPDDALPSNGLQMCPTRIDRAPVLLAHKVTKGQCQDRQRGHYHKCFTCAYNNAWVAKHGWPGRSAPIQELRREAKAG